MTDLVTSAPLELLHLLAAEYRLVERTKCLPLGSLRSRAASLLSSGNTAGYSPSPRPERAASESLRYQSKGKRARGLGEVYHTLARPERHREESSAHEEAARGEARGAARHLGRVGLRCAQAQTQYLSILLLEFVARQAIEVSLS